MREAVFIFIRDYLRKEITRYQGEITPETEFGSKGMALDSIEVLMLILEIENTFQIRIPPKEYTKIRTVGDLFSRTIKQVVPWDFRMAGQGAPDRTALISAKESVSYQELGDRIADAGSFLRAEGIRPHDRVLILMETGLPYIICYFAILETGAVPVLTDPKDRTVTDTALKETSPRCVVTGQARDLPGNFSLHSTWMTGEDPVKVYLCKEGEETQANPLLEKAVLIHYTSGSTGTPCGVVQSAGSYHDMVSRYGTCMGFGDQDIFLMCLPAFHGYGLSCVLLPALYSGATVVLMEEFLPRRALELIKTYQVSHLYAVPAMFALLLQAGKNDPDSFNSIRYCCSSSLSLDPQLITRFYEGTGLVIQQEYGSGETGVISFSVDEALHEGEYSVGKLMEGVSARIDEQGQLLVRSDGIALGYVSGELFPEWYPTGDQAEIIDGRVYLRGRIKKLLDTGGQKVSSEEIDQVLNRFPGVNKAVSFQLREKNGLGYIGAFVCMDQKKETTAEEIAQFCSRHLAENKIPRRIILVDDIPLSAAGKITKNSIEELKSRYL